MGVIISIFAALYKPIQARREKKKREDIHETDGHQDPPQQRFSQQERRRDAQAGVQDEHSPSVPLAGTVQLGEQSQDTVSRSSKAPHTTGLTTGTNRGHSHTATTTDTAEIDRQGEGDHKMASDEDYAAFLDKANQDPNEGLSAKAESSGKVELKATDQGSEIPPVLQKVAGEAFYVSDADEPFVPVCLKLGKGKTGLPDEATFAKLVNHPSKEKAQVSILDVGEWDQAGQYKDVVDATREASKGSDVRVYRIEREGARVEYWVVGTEDGKLVGMKALAIES